MIAAIYARKSTEQNAVADEAKSVTRQIEHARAYAAAKGWTVADEHVYSDEGISGAEFIKRPGFVQMMDALRPRPPFQVIIMSEESRLGREQIETAWQLKQITDAGVRVFFYLEDRERTLDTAMEKVMLSFANFASETERERTRQRTRDALQRRHAQGHIPGGRVFGYRRDYGQECIDAEQAAVIRRIFEEIAEGRGFATVAKRLTAEGVPSPRPGRGWAMGGVRAIVFRDTYRGRVTWGRTRWLYRRGTRVREARPESEWLTQDVAGLRIVSEELWRAAHDRLARTRATYLRATGGKLFGRPESGIESKYLLTGFLACGECGSGMHARRVGGRRLCYVCTWHVTRGATVCRNGAGAPLSGLDGLDAAVLDQIKTRVLASDVFEDIVTRALALWNGDGDEDPREALKREAARTEDEIARYTAAIGHGGPIPELVAALTARRRRLVEVQAALGRLNGPRCDAADVLPDLRDQLTDWQGLLDQEPAAARQLLRKILEGRLALAPRATPEGRFYEFSGRASYGRLLSGIVGLKGYAPGSC